MTERKKESRRDMSEGGLEQAHFGGGGGGESV